MARNTAYTYLVDNITAQNAELLRKALLSNTKIIDVAVKLNSGVVVVTASKDPEAEIKMACSIAGCIFRMKVSKRKANYWA
ncbi:MAG: hypothetical protein PQJ61_11260 [Spirochaetales bacterium]|uniref:Uncharacterized protein n=1 Tax=Candidatus Thalassospirochaeta sargassi TaxID=3119039 RepID=A0AAJ1MP69_9SPIO|nr:hypothetical protein [Spirochaetales bacterium]